MSLPFALAIDRAFKNMIEKSQKIQSIIALEAARQLKIENPVDTGYSRENWQIALTTDVNEVSKKTNGKGSAPKVVLKPVEPKGPFTSLFVINPIPYVVYLNDSHPDKAGFFDAVVNSMGDRAKDIARDLK